MKRIALLIAVIMSLMTFSCVFATEEENLLISPAPEAAEENANEEDGAVATQNETDATEASETTDGGEAVEESTDTDEKTESDETAEAPTTGSTATVDENTTAEAEQKSNSTIIGAIIAIVIVVVIVALAALVQKR